MDSRQAALTVSSIVIPNQLDYCYRPGNFVEIMPRLDEHLRRVKAKGATV
jgi:molybdopterin adenylyltransferase